jgi:hypothetical protein
VGGLKSSNVDPSTGTLPNDRSLNSGKREPDLVSVTSVNWTRADGPGFGKARLYLVGIACGREEAESRGKKTGAFGFKEGEGMVSIISKQRSKLRKMP